MFLLNDNTTTWRDIEPFRHWVIDNFLHEETLSDYLEQFPEPTESWYRYENHFEVKRATDKWTHIPKDLWIFLSVMNTSAFLDQLEQLTGIEGLIPDPRFRGGGLHYIKSGGKLDIHADFNWHKELKLDRRLNVLLYLNKNYRPEYGGQLELWDPSMQNCVRKIDPTFNRLVIFETTDFSFHGHPEPWRGPDPRRSIAWYFYTNGRPAHEKTPPHSTKFQKRPNDDTSEEIEALRAKRNEGRL